jgi:hypothetical protein
MPMISLNMTVSSLGTNLAQLLMQKMVQTLQIVLILATLLSRWFKQIDKTFPLVCRLIELALILRFVTATVERAFSAKKIIKIDLRNKMNDDWMNHNMLCYIKRYIFASIEDDNFLDCFQSIRSRKNQIPRSGNLLSYK